MHGEIDVGMRPKWNTAMIAAADGETFRPMRNDERDVRLGTLIRVLFRDKSGDLMQKLAVVCVGEHGFAHLAPLRESRQDDGTVAADAERERAAAVAKRLQHAIERVNAKYSRMAHGRGEAHDKAHWDGLVQDAVALLLTAHVLHIHTVEASEDVRDGLRARAAELDASIEEAEVAIGIANRRRGRVAQALEKPNTGVVHKERYPEATYRTA